MKSVDFSAEAVYFMRASRALFDHSEKEELEYHIIGINKSGEGQACNTVMVVCEMESICL